MRLSDIFKKVNGQPAASPRNQTPAPQTPSPFRPPITAKAPSPPSFPSPEPLSPPASPEEAYTAAIVEIKHVIAALQEGRAYAEPIRSVDTLVALVEKRSEDILTLATRSTPDVYIYGHSANVCIFTLLIGRASGLDPAELTDLGLCALLHDIGMAKYLKTALKADKLSSQEYALIKKHPAEGKELAGLLTAFPENTRSFLGEIIVQVHERKNGTGYPNALKGNEIHRYARMIGVADIYEAFTHPRSHRERALPHEALKEMVDGADNEFDAAILKSFIEHLSLYPPGSYVRLNTDEIARVTGINRKLPTRPRIRIIIDQNLSRLHEPKNIDLSAVPVLFIREAVDETRLNLPDKKFALELKAARWWVKGL